MQGLRVLGSRSLPLVHLKKKKKCWDLLLMSAIGSEGMYKDQLVMSALGTGLGAVFLPG